MSAFVFIHLPMDIKQWNNEQTRGTVRSIAAKSTHEHRRGGQHRHHQTLQIQKSPKRHATKTTSANTSHRLLWENRGAASDGCSAAAASPPPLFAEFPTRAVESAFQLKLLDDKENVVLPALARLAISPYKALRRFGQSVGQAMAEYLSELILRDAAPMAAALLLGSAYTLSDQGYDPSTHPAFLELRGLALAKLAKNTMLTIDDQVIVAALLATCDAMYGRGEDHATHMKGIEGLLDGRKPRGRVQQALQALPPPICTLGMIDPCGWTYSYEW